MTIFFMQVLFGNQIPVLADTEEPQVETTYVEAVVTNVDKSQWKTNNNRYKVQYTVYIDEYNLTRELTAIHNGYISDMAKEFPIWYTERDDVVTVKVITYRDSGGAVIRRIVQQL